VTLGTRPDLTERKALSKSELNTAALCQRKAHYMRTVPRPFEPVEKVTFGAAVDAGVEVIVTALRAGVPLVIDTALAAAFAVVQRDGIAVDFDGVEDALRTFPEVVGPQFDWAFCATQPHIALTLPVIGDVDGHPDIILADGTILDVKTAARAKTPEDVRYGIELGFYALLREAEKGERAPQVGYITWLRQVKPMWQVLLEPVTDDMLRRADLWAAQYAYAVRINEKAGANVALTGTPRSWKLCNDCQWADICPLAVRGDEE
jgi:PD-(D/E)XK nuclease superfamily